MLWNHQPRKMILNRHQQMNRPKQLSRLHSLLLRRKLWVGSIVSKSWTDYAHCLQYLCGLKSIDANPPTVRIITDHPSVFQETGFDVLDAGHNCCNFEGMPGGIDWQEISPHMISLWLALGAQEVRSL